jgi:hypothetical protein
MDDTELEILKERVKQLEEAVLSLSADIQGINIGMKDMQQIIIKIATNQNQIAERVSMWPYIKVPTKKPNKHKGSGLSGELD